MDIKVVIGTICALGILGIIFFGVPLVSTTETYYETEPYTEQVRIQYQDVDSTLTDSWNITLGFYHIGNVTIRNVDTEVGTFIVNFKFYNVHGLAKEDSDQYPIASGDEHTFEFIYDSEMGEDVTANYSVQAPYKSVTSYREVQKQRTVRKTLFEFIFGK